LKGRVFCAGAKIKKKETNLPFKGRAWVEMGFRLDLPARSKKPRFPGLSGH
jgi:hypothetical protein